MRPQYKTHVTTDEFTAAAASSFDYAFTGESVFSGWEKPQVPDSFGVGLIVGPSGSGKSLLLSEFGQMDEFSWEKDKAIVSHFSSPEEAIERLMAVGLNSVPSWCKPHHVLSNGEKFRADLARRLRDQAVVDEFTSVVDRQVARSVSVSVRRFVDRYDIKGVVLASCHFDILEWLRPDWWFDTTDGSLHSGRGLRRPPIVLRVYPCKRSVWPVFAPHHYLSSKLNPSCRSYLATGCFDGREQPLGFSSSLAFPNGYIEQAYREHRTVVLPDFQGIGFGPRISDMVAQIHINEGKRFFSRTSHPRFGRYRDASPLWKKTSKYRKQRKDVADNVSRGKTFYNNYIGDSTRVCYSHEYVGKREDWLDELEMFSREG